MGYKEPTPKKEGTREPPRNTSIKKVKKFGVKDVKMHFTESVDSIKEMFSTADQLLADDEKSEGARNIWRLQVVLLASALDFYMHELTKYGLDEIYMGNWKRTKAYDSLQVPMSTVAKAIETNGRHAWFLEYVNDHYLHVSMLSYKKIEEQLGLLGISIKSVAYIVYSDDDGDWGIQEVSEETDDFGNHDEFAGEDEPDTLKGQKKSKLARLNEDIGNFCKRRNFIAHQTDRNSTNAKEMNITKEDVLSYISYISGLVYAIDTVASEKTDDVALRQSMERI